MVEGEARLVKAILGYMVSPVFPTSQENKGNGPENDLCNNCLPPVPFSALKSGLSLSWPDPCRKMTYYISETVQMVVPAIPVSANPIVLVSLGCCNKLPKTVTRLLGFFPTILDKEV